MPRAQSGTQFKLAPSLWGEISFKHTDPNRRPGLFQRPAKTGRLLKQKEKVFCDTSFVINFQKLTCLILSCCF